MTHAERKELTEELFNNCLRILEGKGFAYAGKEDVLANFKRVSIGLGLSKYQVWAVYFNKHIDSINNTIKYDPSHPVDKTEGLSGRIEDSINYLTILKCLLVEDEEK